MLVVPCLIPIKVMAQPLLYSSCGMELLNFSRYFFVSRYRSTAPSYYRMTIQRNTSLHYRFTKKIINEYTSTQPMNPTFLSLKDLRTTITSCRFFRIRSIIKCQKDVQPQDSNLFYLLLFKDQNDYKVTTDPTPLDHLVRRQKPYNKFLGFNKKKTEEIVSGGNESQLGCC